VKISSSSWPLAELVTGLVLRFEPGVALLPPVGLERFLEGVLVGVEGMVVVPFAEVLFLDSLRIFW
jgi:hypothetical protein